MYFRIFRPPTNPDTKALGWRENRQTAASLCLHRRGGSQNPDQTVNWDSDLNTDGVTALLLLAYTVSETDPDVLFICNKLSFWFVFQVSKQKIQRK